MAGLKIHQEKIGSEEAKALQALCPFGALEYHENTLTVNSACRLCRICVRQGPPGLIEYVEEEHSGVNKDDWKGVAVFCETEQDAPAPVSLELLGKARELAGVISQPVFALVIGHNTRCTVQSLLCHGADRVYTYDAPRLAGFRVLPYAAAFEDFIRKVRPGSVLVGATALGRSLAPRVAARFNTGLTADCTRLEMKPNTDLVQIRPAFGGNIMAQITTPKHRPQFCTVRYKIFSPPAPHEPSGEVVFMPVTEEMLRDATEVLLVQRQEKQPDISEAEAIVAVGRGLRSQKDLQLAKELAGALGAQLACTRPLVENGWFGAKKQIGLSGRTVKPKLIVALGISGSVQFAAGMQNSGCIIAVNSDEAAPIFNIAHYGIVGDLYSVVPLLLDKIKSGRALPGEDC